MRAAIVLAVSGLSFIGAVGAFAAAESSFAKDQKAHYLSEKDLAFIRPGLSLEILEASIDEQGLIAYRFKITDPGGLPLDLNGVFTPGAVTIRSVAATIPADSEQFSAYTTRTKTDPESGRSSLQATSDSGGSFERVADGEYVYSFAARAPMGYDRTASHRIAVWARRDLEEFGLGEEATSDTFDFAPDGSPPPKMREIVNDQACNACHGELSFHDQRTGVNLCITCHYPATNPESDNSIDFRVMVHKIHAGEQLPSVEAGNPYFFVGFGGRIVDYSDVLYPADLRFCETCHTQDPPAQVAALEGGAEALVTPASLAPVRSRSRGAAQRAELQARVEQAQGQKWLTNPGRAQCGSCHDDVNFATGENHAGLPQISDNQCMRCHAPQGELEYDLSIKGSHTVERYSQELPGTNFEILDIVDTAPGQTPTVTFSLKEDSGNPIPPSDVARLNIYLAGPTTDISQWFSEGASSAQGSGGVYTWTFQTPIPAEAIGSWAVGIEGQVPRTILAGTAQERNVNQAGFNPVKYFSVTGGQTQPRRSIVSMERCASCHVDFTLHGGPRNNPEFCVFCHNTSGTDVVRRPEEQMPPESINFKDMVHRIHAGQAQSRDYTIYGFGGAPHNYNNVRYPNSLADCDACHVGGSQNLPLSAGLLPTVSPRDPFFDPLPPVTGSCLSCHTSQFAAAHADVNISDRLGESCATCHGDDKSFSVERLHAR